MVEVVLEADRDIGLIWLRLHKEGVFVIAINVYLSLVHHSGDSLQLVWLKSHLNVIILQLAIVSMVLIVVFVLRGRYKGSLLAQILLLTDFITDLKYFVLTGRDVLDAWVDSALFCHFVYEKLGVGWLLICEINFIDILIYFKFFLLVLYLFT